MASAHDASHATLPDAPRLSRPICCDDDQVTEDPAAPTPVILGIDDLRSLPRATRIARTSREGIHLLQEHRDGFIDELWLDHDLGGDDSIMPVVTLMEEAAFSGRPFRIGTVFVHSANPIGAESVVRALTRWNYQVRRTTAPPVPNNRPQARAAQEPGSHHPGLRNQTDPGPQ
ncbi:cyclic-phosphate processing receiver domain-containing protein [Streptomyces chattanoogensis]|uniref:cyclic-phosphate processing receiver domain-containing protein n=1 Tax=Streptomyces chattanoogensis TaxID=66876 RepID=UPI0036C98545